MDCREFLNLIPDNSIDLVVTSPPYDDLRDYNKTSNWNFDIFKEIATLLFKKIKKGGVLVWVISDKTQNGSKTLTSFQQALYFKEIGFKIYDNIIYSKSGTGPPHINRYFNSYEYMFIISKGKMKTINLLKDKKNKWAGYKTYSSITRREKDGTLTEKGVKTIGEYGVRNNIWHYNNGKNFSTKDKIAYKHPAIFPEKLVEDHILSWSNEGDIILDIFGGSGTTFKVARKLNRNSIYVDSSIEYTNIALKRLTSNDIYPATTDSYELENIQLKVFDKRGIYGK